jgi:hypothetical protein
MAAWMTYKSVDLFRPVGSTAYTYKTTRMALDADGAPKAYHPDNVSGLDDPANAGFPHGGWKDVLVADPANPGRPFVQPNGPTAGFFVSMTALQGAGDATDPKKYVDAGQIPYLVFPGNFHKLKGTGTTGDFVMAKNLNNGRVISGLVADIGGADHDLGEVSLAMATGLGGNNPNPRNGKGMPPGPYRYVVFPSSHKAPKWPLTAAQVDQAAQALLAAAGGWAAFESLS